MLGGVGQTMGILYLRKSCHLENYCQRPILRHAANVRIEIQGTQLILVSMAANRVAPTPASLLPHSPRQGGIYKRLREKTWGTVRGRRRETNKDVTLVASARTSRSLKGVGSETAFLPL